MKRHRVNVHHELVRFLQRVISYPFHDSFHFFFSANQGSVKPGSRVSPGCLSVGQNSKTGVKYRKLAFFAFTHVLPNPFSKHGRGRARAADGPPATAEDSRPSPDGLPVTATSFLAGFPGTASVLSECNLGFPSCLWGDTTPFNEERAARGLSTYNVNSDASD